jgi:hypothetical protein
MLWRSFALTPFRSPLKLTSEFIPTLSGSVRLLSHLLSEVCQRDTVCLRVTNIGGSILSRLFDLSLSSP